MAGFGFWLFVSVVIFICAFEDEIRAWIKSKSK